MDLLKYSLPISIINKTIYINKTHHIYHIYYINKFNILKI